MTEIWTPLHTRIIAHRIGDGTVNFYGKAVWDNKKTREFERVCRFLGIKLWKPVTSDVYGTRKIVIPTSLFENFGLLFNKDPKLLIKDRIYLLDAIRKLPKIHKLHAILSLIIDDGSFSSWMLVVFEDKDKAVVEKVQELWEDLFPKTSRIEYHLTENRTRVYHLYANRDGIIALNKMINEAIEEYGYLGGLWWKEASLKQRYLKATTPYARKLEETRKNIEKWKGKVIKCVKEKGFINIPDIQQLLNLSRDRAWNILVSLKNEDKLVVIGIGKNRKFVLKKQE